MDVREKLIEILKQAPFDGKVLDEWWWEENIKRIADHLISNGVTVQEWISVTGSPTGNGCYIVVVNNWVDGKPVVLEAYWNGCCWLSCDKKRELTPMVTYWMPLPQPPKGE